MLSKTWLLEAHMKYVTSLSSLRGGRVSLFPCNLKYLSISELQKWKMSYSKAALSTVVLLARLWVAASWKSILASVFKAPCPLSEIAFVFLSLLKPLRANFTAKKGKSFHFRLMSERELGPGRAREEARQWQPQVCSVTPLPGAVLMCLLVPLLFSQDCPLRFLLLSGTSCNIHPDHTVCL